MKNKNGFTLIEIMIVIAIIGLLAAIAIPNFTRARNDSYRNDCIRHLKLIRDAKSTWALEHKKSTQDVPTPNELFGATRYLKESKCPAGGEYSLNAVDTPPSCSLERLGHVLGVK